MKSSLRRLALTGLLLLSANAFSQDINFWVTRYGLKMLSVLRYKGPVKNQP